jgi:hypothetical protein
MASQSWDLDGPERRFQAFAEQYDLLAFQPLAKFREQLAEERLYFGSVGHLNPRGHELLAGQIAEFVEQHGLLPEGAAKTTTSRATR